MAAIGAVSAKTDVIVVTGSNDDADRTAALDAGASAVASKATPADDLVALIEGRSPGSSAPVVRPAVAARFALTEREHQVLQCLSEGDGTKRIAHRLDMRSATARSHVQSLMLKMGVHSRAAAVAHSVREGLVDISR